MTHIIRFDFEGFDSEYRLCESIARALEYMSCMYSTASMTCFIDGVLFQQAPTRFDSEGDPYYMFDVEEQMEIIKSPMTSII